MVWALGDLGAAQRQVDSVLGDVSDLGCVDEPGAVVGVDYQPVEDVFCLDREDSVDRSDPFSVSVVHRGPRRQSRIGDGTAGVALFGHRVRTLAHPGCIPGRLGEKGLHLQFMGSTHALSCLMQPTKEESKMIRHGKKLLVIVGAVAECASKQAGHLDVVFDDQNAHCRSRSRTNMNRELTDS